jgi:hypothetical protein
MAAPVLSVTVPRMVAVVPWANRRVMPLPPRVMTIRTVIIAINVNGLLPDVEDFIKINMVIPLLVNRPLI